MTNCMATNIATTMSAVAKFSTSLFMAVLIDLFKKNIRTTNELPTRSITTMNEKAVIRPTYWIDKLMIQALKISENKIYVMRRKLAQIQSGYTLHQHHGYHVCPVELSVKAVTKLLCHADKALWGRNSCSWLSLSGRVIQQCACVRLWLHPGAGEVCGIHLHYFWLKSKLIRGNNKVPKHVQQYK